jgi:transposase
MRPVVGADETRLRIVRDQGGKSKNGFVRTFGARDDAGGLDVAYVFTEDRSGSTPKTLLEGTTGVLLVDGYSGYNVMEEVSTRRRAACNAHLRRYFHEALPTAPIAQEMLDLVAELYVRRARGRRGGLVGASTLDFRKQRAGPVRARMRAWLDVHRERHPPKSPIATAIRYADNQWEELGGFPDDERVPLDNDGSERALRRVALGRKNDLFVHDVEHGASIAGLYGPPPRRPSPAAPKPGFILRHRAQVDLEGIGDHTTSTPSYPKTRSAALCGVPTILAPLRRRGDRGVGSLLGAREAVDMPPRAREGATLRS